MKEKSGFRIVFMTAPDQDTAAAIAKGAVEKRLAACANVVSFVRSIYRWKGEICDEGEALVIFKTRSELLAGLESHVTANHPYEVPELVAVEIGAGLERYLDWISNSTGSDGIESQG
jgi:periplasmic divalent cation tolerance protein